MHLPTYDNIKRMSDETLKTLCEEIEFMLKNNLFDETIQKLLQAFLDYGRLTIMGRAFPKVEDGLKPVHRRILYTMNDLSLTPTSPHKKSARITGHAIGIYHPHGDKSVYDAMVRMAQEFSLRVPLVDGQGNFGTIEGDDPASMRYCVTGDTLIKTPTGLFKIKDLVSDSSIKEQEINLSVFSLGNKINSASKFFNSGKHKILTIKSKKGYSISGSLNHPILTLSKDETGKPFLFWKVLENLTTEDIIVIDRNLLKINKRKHLLELFKNNGSFVFNSEKQYNEIYFNLDKETAKETQIYLLSYGIYSTQIETEDNKIKLFLGDKANSELFINRIWLNKKDFKIEFSKNKIPYLNDYIKNKYKDSLSLIHFFEKIKVDNYQDINTYLFVNGILNQFDKEDKEFINLLRENYYLFDQIDSIKESEEQEVYSIKVDNECHSFIGNGIINHNTEATVTKAGYNFFKDLEKEVVDFVPNYDETTKEPLVLPVKFPNLIINGTNGIAVGMSSVIPPHNPIEVIETAKYLVKVRKGLETYSIDTILSLLPGPDFPTGGILYNTDSMKDIFEKGSGRMKLKAKYELEKTKRKESIVVTEIPYMVDIPVIFNKLKEITNNLKNDKNYEIFQNSISAVRNESSGKDGIRIVIDLKNGVDSELIWNQIVKITELDRTISYIPNVLNLENKPEEMSLRKMFESFIDFRLSVILKKYTFIKKEKEDELEIVQGFLKAMDLLDEIIHVIRNAETDLESFTFLLSKGFTERQSKAILNLRLGKLTKLEKLKLKEEETKLESIITNAKKMIESDTLKYNEIIKDLEESKELFVEKDRKTIIDNSVSVLSATDLVKKEECMVYFTDIGYVFKEPIIKDKRVKSKFELIENDFLVNSFLTDSHSYLFFITNKGNIFGIKAFNIVQDKSIFVNNLFELQAEEHVIKCVEAQDLEGYDLIFGTKQGYIKRTALSEYSGALRKTGVLGTKLENGDELVFIYLSKNENDEVLVFNSEGKIIRFALSEVSSVGRNARGVISMRTEGVVLGGFVGSVNENTTMISISELGYIKSESLNAIPTQKRAGKGVYIYKESAKAGGILDGKILNNEEDILIKLSSENKRFLLSELETKAVIGLKLLKFSKTDKFLTSLSVPKIKQEESEI